jgi:hypothetical protein
LGGKGHEFFVELLGLLSGAATVADHRVLANTRQPRRLADATAFGEVVQDSDDLLLGEPSVKQGRAFAFGEACLAGATVEETALTRPVVAANREVALPAFAEIRAVAVLTAENAEIVHGRSVAGRGERAVEWLPLL